MHLSATATALLLLATALALAVLVAALVAYVAARLARADGATCPTALARAAVAFAGTLTLLAVLTATVTGLLR